MNKKSYSERYDAATYTDTQRNKDCIEVLEDLLALARTGDMTSLFILYQKPSRSEELLSSGCADADWIINSVRSAHASLKAGQFPTVVRDH